ncbi:bifunctional proline dehydrogenase/L-glutamate gamma-semialdehyde dehydrogenase PutA [Ahrensia marina]|uniref:bifunctional proline dehydrogenase/L-glutamate gamma-semialdehyde dehydrogenase PutA n=1 Tax=Ahrensia marina TaxID=1514904 RepID=UPI0035D07D40
MTRLEDHRQTIRHQTLEEEALVLNRLMKAAVISDDTRHRAGQRAIDLVQAIRAVKKPGLMEVFLAEYGLSTDEGVALMCLAEALLRVPDTDTIDALIEDKIAPSAWGEHLGKSSSSLVNASTWALMLTGKVLSDGKGTAAVLQSALKRLGEPVIRMAVTSAMKELGGHFVLGQTIDEALERGRSAEKAGYTFSYDMLGEAALTERDAQAFFDAYADAIQRLSGECRSKDIRQNPGISIKLSALHPRYELGQRDRVMDELVKQASQLARMAREAGMGLNVDAEEADRLDLSLDVIEAVLSDPELAGWDGFGVVVQAYGKRALPVIDWLYTLAEKHDRKIMVRLVKGAYWDTEIKRAQVEGLSGYPVFTRKPATDVSYICCAHRLLRLTDRLYPQFATHNAHSVAAILEMAENQDAFEFQRLHGMGEALYDVVRETGDARCRIYAPVGPHRDLLAYLVRRLLENGANSSFVNQIVDVDVPADLIAKDPFEAVKTAQPPVLLPKDLYAPERTNSHGFDLKDPVDVATYEQLRAPFQATQWETGPILAEAAGGEAAEPVHNPADPSDVVGTLRSCSKADVETALRLAKPWAASPNQRAETLKQAADLYETCAGEIFAVLAREAGKTPTDAIAELREAVDFLRYYAAGTSELDAPARGVFSCISPWNFPLAIFTGQIAAALAAGNGVLAKPAEPTGLIAGLAVQLLHRAGVPKTALQLVPGAGSVVGARITASPDVHGICFTGSTATAKSIHRTMIDHCEPTAPLIAETGGLNAMIVDSTALPEQAIKDIVASAFQSAGQRCSALRILYLQDDVADTFLDMLFGAMDELVIGNPWHLSTDVGPIINQAARAGILNHIEKAEASGAVLKRNNAPSTGIFVAPTVIKVGGIADLEEEIFGPVLHVATFKAADLQDVIKDINASGYGLTFGIHSRIDDRVQLLSSEIEAGNIYVNRNQIGAIVGSQPFGGEGLSGTGPKAGGPNYVARFTRPERTISQLGAPRTADTNTVQCLLDDAKTDPQSLSTTSLPGPTGESNRLSEHGRGTVLCLGPTPEDAALQAKLVRENGCAAVCVADGLASKDGAHGGLPPAALAELGGFEAVVCFAEDTHLRQLRKVLASRDGPIIPLLAEQDFARWCRLERHVCIDTTAAGGNASLLAEAS